MIPTYIVTENPDKFILKLDGVEVIAAKQYLMNPFYSHLKSAKIFNLCKSYRYQGEGYYVSLLATARRHRVMPDPITIQDFKSQNIIKIFSLEVDALIQKAFKNLKSDEFVLSIYFGRNMAHNYDELAKKLFMHVKAPLLRAQFEKNGKWILKSLRPIPFSEVDEKHIPFLAEAANDYFRKRNSLSAKGLKNYHYDLAILINPEEVSPPSNEKALMKFIQAAKQIGIKADIITKEDAHKILEYDALFIRETTSVPHHTYRIARKAMAEGLVVIDNPESIVKCTNKVFLEEILSQKGIPRPLTFILHEHNMQEIAEKITFPCVMKQPDSAFSQGVFKAENLGHFIEMAEKLLEKSDLVIVQEFIQSDFDWRIGILNNRPLFACKYFMVQGHWQIKNHISETVCHDGAAETLPIDLVPPRIVEIALKASKLIGDGLFGIDLKQVGDKVYLIEVNDNPNIDFGVEDLVAKDDLYLEIMKYFNQKLNKQRLLDTL
ncbi:MAG: RimK family protein [Bdellovibrio sp.]|nr:RimK family protein [Bdellovibrio sp.]